MLMRTAQLEWTGFVMKALLRGMMLSGMALFFAAGLGSGASLAQTLETLEITTASGEHNFSVEVMRTPAELEKGLMYRRFLPEDRGMLFDFQAEKPVMMWMKNTYVPLDMIFIGKSGKVVSIAQHAEPMSEKIISSGKPSYGVLEVNAGTASKIGLKVGDEVHHPLFEH